MNNKTLISGTEDKRTNITTKDALIKSLILQEIPRVLGTVN